jgi:ribosomal-protein-alanine N-acetyltransferase
MKRTNMNKKPILPREYGQLLIREFTDSDRDALLEFTHDPKQLQLMLFSLSTEQEVDEFLAMAQREAQKEDRCEWHLALEEKDTPGFIGSVALMVGKEARSSAELGYWFKRSVWGHGYATEASRFMLEVGFSTLGLHRIWGKCHIKNPASARVMEKLGMQREGLIREHVWLRDHYRSSLLFSMLDHEYQGGPAIVS